MDAFRPGRNPAGAFFLRKRDFAEQNYILRTGSSAHSFFVGKEKHVKDKSNCTGPLAGLLTAAAAGMWTRHRERLPGRVRHGMLTVLLCAAVCAGLTGCASVGPKKPDGTYATQNRLSSTEYSIYINKQITVFTGQLMTRMQAILNLKDTTYHDEYALAAHSFSVMQKARDEVEVTYPSTGRDDDRTSVLRAMKTAMDDMNAYLDAIQDGDDLTSYKDTFQGDFNELTGLAALYYE